MSRSECKKYVRCPVCKGVGYFEKGKASVKYDRAGLLLPPVLHNSRSTPIVKLEADDTEYSGAPEDIHLPILTHSTNSSKESSSPVDAGDYNIMIEQDFLGVAEQFENPQEVLKISMQNLKLNQWQASAPAIINLMQISRYQPDLLDSNMSMINRTLCSLMRNTRPQIVRTACQVAMELYKTMQCTQRPEFDELAATLLLKSTHLNKGIRHDAQSALDSMITHIPPAICIRVLVSEHGARHNNPFIRATVSRLLYNVVNVIGVENLMSGSNMKDVRRRIFPVCAKFLVDGNSETRSNAKAILQLLVKHSEFDAVFSQEVDRKVLERIEKELIVLKYQK